MVAELSVQPVERLRGRRLAGGEVVLAVHQDLGLDDRDDAGLLTERRVPRHRVPVREHGEVGRVSSPTKYVARHFANRAPNSRYSASRSRSPSSPSVTVSPSNSASGCAPVSTLIRDHAGLLEHLGERSAVVRGLADRLVEQDHARDVVRERAS